MDNEYALMIAYRDFLVKEKSEHGCFCHSTFHRSDDCLCNSFADVAIRSYVLEGPNFYLLVLS